MIDDLAPSVLARNFVATETTDFGGSNRLLRVVGEVGAPPGVQVSLEEVTPPGDDPHRLLLNLKFQENKPASTERRWTKVQVFERALDKRRQVLHIDIRHGGAIIESLDVAEVVA